MDDLKRAVALFADVGGRPGEQEPEIWKLGRPGERQPATVNAPPS